MLSFILIVFSLSYFYSKKMAIYHAYTLSIFSVVLGEITHLKA